MEKVGQFDYLLGDFEGIDKSFNGSREGLLSNFHSTRRQALNHFMSVGFPTPKVESWKYTNLAPINSGKFRLASKESLSEKELEPYLIKDEGRLTLSFCNGRYLSELSSSRFPEGVTVTPLSSLLYSHGGSTRSHEVFRDYFGKGANYEEESFVSLNTAFVNDGVLIHVSRNSAISNPIQLIFAAKGMASQVHYPRILVVLEDGASLKLIETYVGLDNATYLTAAVSEVFLAEGAVFDQYKVQVEGSSGFHLGRCQAKLSARSVFRTHSFSFGGKLVRNEVCPILGGENIECVLNGLTVLNGDQHVDNSTVLDHAKPNCHSTELFKGIYDQKSKGVFSGTIIVRPDAQKTNAIQSNQAILLSGEAKIESRPQLKIWADDVKCTHGATVGQLDDDALFYIRSRGIGKTEARNMLIKAFCGEVLQGVKLDILRQWLESKMVDKLAKA